MNSQLFPSSTAKRKGHPLASPEPQNANLLPWPKRHQTSSYPLAESDHINRFAVDAISGGGGGGSSQSSSSDLQLRPIHLSHHQASDSTAASSDELPPIQRHHSSAGGLPSGGATFGAIRDDRPPLRRLASLPRLRQHYTSSSSSSSSPHAHVGIHSHLLHPPPRSATTSIGPHFSRESAMRSTCGSLSGGGPGNEVGTFAFSIDDPRCRAQDIGLNKWQGPRLPPISPTYPRHAPTSSSSSAASSSSFPVAFPFPPIHTHPSSHLYTSHGGNGEKMMMTTRHRSLSSASHVAQCFAGLALKDEVVPLGQPGHQIHTHSLSLSISSSNSSLATSGTGQATLPTPALSMGGNSDNERDSYGGGGEDDDELLGSEEEDEEERDGEGNRTFNIDCARLTTHHQGHLVASTSTPISLPPLRPVLDSRVLFSLSPRLQSSIRLHRRLKHFLSTAHLALEPSRISHLSPCHSSDTAPLLTTRLESDDDATEPFVQLGSFKRPVSPSDDGNRASGRGGGGGGGGTTSLIETPYDVAIHRALCFGEIIADAVMMTTPRTTAAAAANGNPIHLTSNGDRSGNSSVGGSVQSLQIACIRLGDTHWITSTDICRILRFRLVAIGWEILDQTKLFEGVYSDLRTVPKSSIRLELPCSPLVATLFELGCVATLKAQKLYEWRSVEHDALLLEAMQRSLDRARRGEDKLACRPGPEGFKLQGGDAGRPLPRQLGITRHTSQASTIVASPSRSLTPAGLARLVLGSDALYRLGHASDASLTLDGRVALDTSSEAVGIGKSNKSKSSSVTPLSVPFPALEEEEQDVNAHGSVEIDAPVLASSPSSSNRPRRRLAPRRLDTAAFSTLSFLR